MSIEDVIDRLDEKTAKIILKDIVKEFEIIKLQLIKMFNDIAKDSERKDKDET